MATPGAWRASEMPKENLGDFKDDWCKDLINSQDVTEVPFQSRTITRNSSLHALFNRTLATNDTLRAAQAFHRSRQDGKEGTECLLLASLGSGLDGHPGLAHGGTIGVLFDEGLSLAALTALRNTFFTVETKIQFKKAMPTPSVILLRSWVDKIDRRKAWISGSMEDGKGTVFATAQCFYIMLSDEAEKKQKEKEQQEQSKL